MANKRKLTAKLGDYFEQRSTPGLEGLPTLSVTLRNGLVFRDDLERKMETNLSAEEHLFVRTGDIAYNMMRMWQGASGRADCDGIVSPAYVVVIPKDGIDTRFAAHWFKSERMIYLFWAYSHGLTEDRLRLYFQDFAEIPVTVPPLAEQRRIASILDEWDHAIACAEQLIEVEKYRKKALSSRLLDACVEGTSQQGWNKLKLGSLFLERTVAGGSQNLLAVTAGQGIIDREETGRKDTSAEDKTNYKLLEPGDIGYNTMRMWQGVSALSTLRGLISPAYTIVRPKEEIDGQFAAQLFKNRHMIHKFWRFSQGLVDDTLSLKFPHFSEIHINLPAIETQRQIGQLLSSADDKISECIKFRDSFRLQKRGLMQKLLSGDWPVPASIDRLLPGGQEVDEAVGAEVHRKEAAG